MTDFKTRIQLAGLCILGVVGSVATHRMSNKSSHRIALPRATWLVDHLVKQVEGEEETGKEDK